jgi:two-component system response regulator AlgR
VKRNYLLEESLTKLDEAFGAHLVRVHCNCLVAGNFILGFEHRVSNEGDAHWEGFVRSIHAQFLGAQIDPLIAAA